MQSVVRVGVGQIPEALHALQKNGFVIVEQAISSQPLSILRNRMDADTVELLDFCESRGGNPRQKGHLQQGPPVSPEFVFSEVAMNPHINALCVALFDGVPKVTFYNGNTNCPSSGEQELHMDGVHLTLEPDPVAPISSVVVNIPSGPMTLENGAIELWPGSHWVRANISNQGMDKATIEARRIDVPPIRVRTQIRDVLIRDVRVWHRGVPNLSNRPRHMIAIVVSDQDTKHRLRFEKGCEAALEGHEVDANAVYTDETVDYLLGPTRSIFEQMKQANAEKGSKS